MSYDVVIEVPADQKIKPRRGEYPERALERLALIESTLRALDPAIDLRRDEAILEADSAILGAVIADPNRITLCYSSAQGYSALLNALHDALAAFEPLGFRGYDPQVGGVIRYSADSPTFLRQFRRQILCSDDEFEQWIHGIEPESWRLRRAARRGYEDGFRAENFPSVNWMPPPHALAALSDDALAALLKRLVDHNNAILDRFGLRDALSLFKNGAGQPRQRGDGSWMPFEVWLYSSSLGQEMALHQMLLRRDWPAFRAHSLQHLRIEADGRGVADRPAYDAEAHEMLRAIFAAAPATGLCEHHAGCLSDGVTSVDLVTPDAKALLAALRSTLQGFRRLRPRAVLRCGGPAVKETIELIV